MKNILLIVLIFFLNIVNAFANRKDDNIKIGIIGPVKDQIFESKGIKHSIPAHIFNNSYQKALINIKNKVDKNQKIVLIPILKYPEMIDYYLENLDGILISGSSIDLHPETYGQKVDPLTNPASLEFSNFDIDLIKKAYQKHIPLLGICYGMQVLSVAFGGELVQNIEGHMNTKHNINITKDSFLYKLNKDQIIAKVNSYHHQAVIKIPKDWLIIAKADDGTIEAIQNLKNSYLFGVQWHPEGMQEDDMNMNIFESFYKEAIKYKNKIL